MYPEESLVNSESVDTLFWGKSLANGEFIDQPAPVTGFIGLCFLNGCCLDTSKRCKWSKKKKACKIMPALRGEGDAGTVTFVF